MADYFMPTVVNPMIPDADITPLEALVLERMFDCERDNDAHYYFTEASINDMPTFEVADIRAALHASRSIPSELSALVEEELGELDATEAYLELDLTLRSSPFIFQDIVKRSASLTEIIVTSSFICSKTRPDGFGGMVTVITANAVPSASTDEMGAQLLDRAQYGDLACAPGHGVHVLLRLGEEDVRATLGEIIETDPDHAAVKKENITNIDIRAACNHIIAARDFSEERGGAVFAAAIHALGTALSR